MCAVNYIIICGCIDGNILVLVGVYIKIGRCLVAVVIYRFWRLIIGMVWFVFYF